MNTITIVIADNPRILRQGVRALLDAQMDLSVIADTGNGLEAVDLVEQLQPDVFILDLMLPGLHGLEVAHLVRQRVSRTRILVLSTFAELETVVQALRNGASGYVLKDADMEILVNAVHAIAAGGRYLCPPLSEIVLDANLRQAEGVRSVDPFDTLTDRERIVFQLIAEGYTNSEVARRLSISLRTVEGHRYRLVRKLGVRTLTDLIRYALRRGIIPLDS